MSSYYVALDGQQAGPFSFPEIQDLVQTGRANTTDLCWADGMADWQPLNTVFSFPPPQPSPSLQPQPSQVRSEPPPSFNPYTAPQAQLPLAALSRRYGGIGRLAYYGLFFGLSTAVVSLSTLSPQVEILDAFLPFIAIGVSLVIIGKRLKNIGVSSWQALLMLVPIANIIIAFRCAAYPEGYQETRRLDLAGKIISGFFVVLFLMFVLAFIKAMMEPGLY